MHLISALGVGGAERMLVDLIESCAEKPQIRHVVVVMNDAVDRNLAVELNTLSIPVYCLHRPESSRNPKYISNLIKIIRLHGVDVIHSHNIGSKYWSMLCRVPFPRLRLVFTLHDTRIGMNRFEVVLHNALIDITIAISRAVAAEAHSLRIARVVQIDNGLPTTRFSGVPTKPLGSTAKVISVARLLPEKKGQDILLRAIKRCIDRGLDVEGALVGSPLVGDSQTLPLLQALVASLRLTGRIRIIQGRSDVVALLRESDIFVMASRFEGFGIALVEAMAAGLPVIASNIDGPAEIITDGVDGLLFESGSDEQLAEKIESVIRSPALAAKLSRNGRITAANYDISTMRDKYLEIYGRLAAPQGTV